MIKHLFKEVLLQYKDKFIRALYIEKLFIVRLDFTCLYFSKRLFQLTVHLSMLPGF